MASSPGIFDVFSDAGNAALSGAGSQIFNRFGQGAAGSFGAALAAGNSLAGIVSRSDPVLSYCWYAQMPTITPLQGGNGPTNQNSSNGIGGFLDNASSVGQSIIDNLGSTLGGSLYTSASAVNLPWYYVEEAQLSFRSFHTKSIFRDGRHKNYPDNYSIDSLTLHFYLDSSNTVWQYLQSWNNCIITPFSSSNAATSGGGFGRPSNYKKSIFIYLLDVAKQQLAIIEYTECWPTNLSSLQLDSGTSTKLSAQVTFSVGDVFINLIGVAQSAIDGILANPGQGANILHNAGNTLSHNVAGAAGSAL